MLCAMHIFQSLERYFFTIVIVRTWFHDSCFTALGKVLPATNRRIVQYIKLSTLRKFNLVSKNANERKSSRINLFLNFDFNFDFKEYKTYCVVFNAYLSKLRMLPLHFNACDRQVIWGGGIHWYSFKVLI